MSGDKAWPLCLRSQVRICRSPYRCVALPLL